MDMSPFLSAIDLSSEVALVLYIAAGLAGVLVVAKGVCLVLKQLTGLDTCNIEGLASLAGSDKPPRTPRSDKGQARESSKGGWC